KTSVTAYIDAQVCSKLYGSVTQTYSQGSTDTSSSSTTATLASSSGVHLPNTPFPAQPAGSVVLVYTIPNQPSQIIRTEVVQRQHASIAPADADVYIVDNDIASQVCQNNTANKLTLTVSTLQNSATAAANVRQALANVLDTITAQSDAIVAQGSFPASEQT